MAKVKCPVCEQQTEKEGMTKVKNRYYHPECLKEKQELNKFKKENPGYVEEFSQGEIKDYNALVDYICQKFNTKKPSGMMFNQIRDYREKYDYTYKGMELALRYFYDIKINTVKEDSGIGIVPYMYDKARRFHSAKIDIQNSIDDYEEEVRLFKPRQQNKVKKRTKQIDINEL